MFDSIREFLLHFSLSIKENCIKISRIVQKFTKNFQFTFLYKYARVQNYQIYYYYTTKFTNCKISLIKFDRARAIQTIRQRCPKIYFYNLNWAKQKERGKKNWSCETTRWNPRVLRYSLLRREEKREFSLTTKLSPLLTADIKKIRNFFNLTRATRVIPVNGGVYLNVIFIHNESESE